MALAKAAAATPDVVTTMRVQLTSRPQRLFARKMDIARDGKGPPAQQQGGPLSREVSIHERSDSPNQRRVTCPSPLIAVKVVGG
eukprot:6938608-Prymnesium_polylepis.1